MLTHDVIRSVMALTVIGGLSAGAHAFDEYEFDASTPPAEALELGLSSYRSGDKESAVEALSFAADKGNAIAQWKLGRMYAEGDGIARDDCKAFELFSDMADEHGGSPSQAESPFVSDAFVALGGYYRDGTECANGKQDLTRAREAYFYAASIYRDPEAQAKLAWMYYQGEGGARDPLQAAKWANLAANKGSVVGQALLGHVLFEGDGVERQPVVGLMYLTIARSQAGPTDGWIFDMQERAVSLATETERRTAMAMADDWLDKQKR